MITFTELPLVESIDSISLDATVRLIECIHGSESFKDQQIKMALQETSLRKKMNQVRVISSSCHPPIDCFILRNRADQRKHQRQWL
jgi:hypothetical protein